MEIKLVFKILFFFTHLVNKRDNVFMKQSTDLYDA